MSSSGALLLATAIALAQILPAIGLTVERGSPQRRSSGPACLSGITYVGGDDYYAIADNGTDCGLYRLTVRLGADGKSVSSWSVGAKRTLAMAADIEGIAFDPGNGKVWVSDEATQTITEYDPVDGTACRRVDVPSVMKRIVGNYGFESLTISGDGLTMWTANEEALTCDGERSSYSAGTTVRLVKFTRESVAGNWTLAAMYPYTTDMWTYQYGYGTAGRKGVSDLCALPDGSLLVLERELSSDEAGTGFWAGLGVTLFYSIYLVTPSAMAAATDIRDANEGLKTLSGWKSVGKIALHRSTTSTTYWSNVEGICLGPRLASGACELLTLTDAGDGNTNAQLIPHVLSGLSIRTMRFDQPGVGVSSLVGSNYRYLDGARVQVRLSGCAADSPYAVDGSRLAACVGWQAAGQNPAEGTERTAVFDIAADGVFSWMTESEIAANGYKVADSFEEYEPETLADDMDGWRGTDCAVEAMNYQPPTHPGFVMQRESHTKVLNAEEEDAVRMLPAPESGMGRIDVMVCLQRSQSPLKSLSNDVQLRVAVDELGRLCLWHLYEEGAEWRKGWVPLSDRTYADGEWVRVEIDFDYTSNKDGDAFACVKVNGSCQPTAHGVRSPTDLRLFGPWHYLARNRRTGGVMLPSEISFSGAKVDDLMLSAQSVEPEHEGPTSVGGIEFSWFDNMGLPRDPTAAAPFIAGYTLGDVHAAGIDPYSRYLPIPGVHSVDSFEEFATGTMANDVMNWSGEDCFVELSSYDPPVPPGFVMTEETHTRVLDVTEDKAIRHVSWAADGENRVDVMVCVQCSGKPLKPLPDDIQLQVAADEQGRLCLWHLYEENGEWRKDWIPLSETVYMNDEWVRLGIEFDYTSNPSGDAFAKVTINGSSQPTAHGVRSPMDLRAYGPWHYLAKNRRTEGVALPCEIGFAGTKVDDLMLCRQSVLPSHEGPTSVDGIEFSWFDNAGLPRNPLAAAPFIPGYTLGDVYVAGLDPFSERPFEVTGFEVDANGKPHVEFNGYKGETPVGYRVLYSSTPDFKNVTTLDTSDGTFDGDAATWSTVWEGKSDAPAGAGFYKVEAVR